MTAFGLIGFSYWWVIIPGLLLGLYAQIKLKSTYSRYIKEPVSTGLTGSEAARAILDNAGLGNMPVNLTAGHLTDHYDPIKKALFLSEENYHGRSLAAVGVAAHEAGHALQHKAAYAPLNLRMMLVPVTNFASMAYLPILIGGMLLQAFHIVAPIVIVIFTVIALFQIVTLPVEFDASKRAKERLLSLGIVQAGESTGVSRVLSAAALTYVAAMVSTVLTLVQWILIARNSD